MSTLNTLDDLLIAQVKDLYSAETQLVEALPRVASSATNSRLRDTISAHLDETKAHVTRLEEVFHALQVPVESEFCHGMEGLLHEANDDMGTMGDPVVKDAAIIANAQRIEHYEIAGYGTAATLAHEIGREDVARILHATLSEEKSADEKLTKVATGGWMRSGVNQEAAKV